MLGGGNENPFFHQAGGVTDLGDVRGFGLHHKPVEIGAPKLQAASSRRRQKAQARTRSAVEPHSFRARGARDRRLEWHLPLILPQA